jgi:hypothetical protein
VKSLRYTYNDDQDWETSVEKLKTYVLHAAPPPQILANPISVQHHPRGHWRGLLARDFDLPPDRHAAVSVSQIHFRRRCRTDASSALTTAAVEKLKALKGVKIELKSRK